MSANNQHYADGIIPNNPEEQGPPPQQFYQPPAQQQQYPVPTSPGPYGQQQYQPPVSPQTQYADNGRIPSMSIPPGSPPPQYIPPPYNGGSVYQTQGGKQEGVFAPTGAPVEVAGSPGAKEARICGMKPRIFWRNFAIIAIVLIAVIVGLAVGLTMMKKNRNSDPVSGQSSEESPSITTTSTVPFRTPTPTTTPGFDPVTTPGGVYSVPTGTWVMPLTLASTSGRCAASTASVAAIANCIATGTYTAVVTGSVQGGYRMTGPDIFDSTKRVAIQGLQPNGTSSSIDSTDRQFWSFANTVEDKAPCSMKEVSIWLFGRDKSTYSVGWSSRNGEACLLKNGLTAPIGTQCTCFYLAGS